MSTEKDQNLTAQEHRHLLKILFSYELQHSQVMIAIALRAFGPFQTIYILILDLLIHNLTTSPFIGRAIHMEWNIQQKFSDDSRSTCSARKIGGKRYSFS